MWWDELRFGDRKIAGDCRLPAAAHQSAALIPSNSASTFSFGGISLGKSA